MLPVTLQDGYSVNGSMHKVLLNEQGQYSLWPALKTAPSGWSQVGPIGDRDVCLGYIEQQSTK